MKLTKKQAIVNHRKMWNWTADKTEERGKKVQKADYFRENGITDKVHSLCFCCEFARQFIFSGKKCVFCPIKWGNNKNATCCIDGEGSLGIYNNFIESSVDDIDGYGSVQLAREIANLPEKPNSEIIRAAFREAEYPYVDELDFYMALVDSGFTVDDVRECMGDEAADHMQQFCKEHGLV